MTVLARTSVDIVANRDGTKKVTITNPDGSSTEIKVNPKPTPRPK